MYVGVGVVLGQLSVCVVVIQFRRQFCGCVGVGGSCVVHIC